MPGILRMLERESCRLESFSGRRAVALGVPAPPIRTAALGYSQHPGRATCGRFPEPSGKRFRHSHPVCRAAARPAGLVNNRALPAGERANPLIDQAYLDLLRTQLLVDGAPVVADDALRRCKIGERAQASYVNRCRRHLKRHGPLE